MSLRYKYNSSGERWCGNCKLHHHKSMFGKNKASKDGLSYSCAQSLKDATNERRGKTLKSKQNIERLDNNGDPTDSAIKKLKAIQPYMKLANPYEYKRPDAWELHQQNMTQNIQRTEEYIKLLHSIESCTNATQLKQLSESVIAYHKNKKQDSGELLSEYMQKEKSLSVE